MAQSKILTGLTPREAIADSIHRCILGIDTNDRDLFDSTWVKDENTKVVAGPYTMDGWNAINEFWARVFTVTTTHFLTNIRVDVKDGADAAHLTAHAIAYHIRPDEAFNREDASYTAGCLYFIDLVKDGIDGSWKITKWEIKIQWTTGDMAVLHG